MPDNNNNEEIKDMKLDRTFSSIDEVKNSDLPHPLIEKILSTRGHDDTAWHGKGYFSLTWPDKKTPNVDFNEKKRDIHFERAEPGRFERPDERPDRGRFERPVERPDTDRF